MSKTLKKGRWTPEEIAYLKKFGKNTPTRNIAVALGRGYDCVKKRLSRMGLRKNLGYLKKLGRSR